ncbi:Uncharacterized conserved protein YciI, contains a putative active-site phosphohistidine [Muriicola jejuensis]|uniref:YCII-related domain-containing protein n=1 Tax=Muriicola jejuensis TaxID=504488 RepID=A0A6P0UCA3_9FLAO|nr:YciI family protein [Muriicola jejuensis]NER10120.1 hypothetical protein [Muriicola jejuensis]SMP02821.1 Uncharacterized conserved protein YciI, contains a putative active-site phosphohistidine [Muriicola jejuensis]
MEKCLKLFCLILVLILMSSCAERKSPKEPHADTHEESRPSLAQVKQNLVDKGYEIFDYIDPKTADTVLMQQYFIAFLKKGPTRSKSKEEADSLQALHLEHLSRMYDLGYADISGPFGDDGEIRGITIYNTPTLEMADSLANSDPMVKAGRLVIEVHPWWAAKGFPLR